MTEVKAKINASASVFRVDDAAMPMLRILRKKDAPSDKKELANLMAKHFSLTDLQKKLCYSKNGAPVFVHMTNVTLMGLQNAGLVENRDSGWYITKKGCELFESFWRLKDSGEEPPEEVDE